MLAMWCRAGVPSLRGRGCRNRGRPAVHAGSSSIRRLYAWMRRTRSNLYASATYPGPDAVPAQPACACHARPRAGRREDALRTGAEGDRLVRPCSHSDRRREASCRRPRPGRPWAVTASAPPRATAEADHRRRGGPGRLCRGGPVRLSSAPRGGAGRGMGRGVRHRRAAPLRTRAAAARLNLHGPRDPAPPGQAGSSILATPSPPGRQPARGMPASPRGPGPDGAACPPEARPGLRRPSCPGFDRTGRRPADATASRGPVPIPAGRGAGYRVVRRTAGRMRHGGPARSSRRARR